MKKLLIKMFVKLAYMVGLAKSVPYYVFLLIAYVVLAIGACCVGGYLGFAALKAILEWTI